MASIFDGPSVCTALCALVIASPVATARAEPLGVPDIPAAEPKTATTPDRELPLPYDSWDGGGTLPPNPHPRTDTPLPFARARELPRRPFELGASFSALLPSCGAGSIDSRGCSSVHPSGGVDLAFVYRVTPFFGVGLEGVVSGLRGDGGGPLSAAGGSVRFGGVLGRVYFADGGAWDPYLALTLGAGTLTLPDPQGDSRAATTGLGARVAGGVDYLLGSHLRLGPTAGFAHWLAWSEQDCARDVCRRQSLAYGRLLGFATLGLRLTGTFGESL